MKKVTLLAILSVLVLLAQSAWATSTISASPSSQIVTDNSTFSVAFSLNVTGGGSDPASIAGVDLFLGAVNSQNGGTIVSLFNINSQSAATGWLPAGPGVYPDAFQTATVHTAGTAENTQDQAVSKNVTSATPFTGGFETLTLSIGNAPAGTYNFFTTTPSSTTDGRGTHITDSTGSYFIPTTQAAFSIVVVPEPATLSLFGLGAVGAIGLTLLRRRRNLG